MVVKTFMNTGKAFPGLSLDLSKAIREKSKTVSNDPYEQSLIQNDLYKKALDEKKHAEFLEERNQGKMELYEKSVTSKNVIEKKDNNTLSRTGALADMLREYGHSLGKNWDSIGDQELIERFTAKNPGQKTDFDDFINGNESEYSFAKRMGFATSKGTEDNETFGQKVADVAVGAIQSPAKRGYNMVGQWIDRLGKRGAEQLKGSDLDKWVNEKAIELFGEDEVKAYQEQKKKELEEGTAFNGREQTDIRTPLLGEERANNKYTKAGEVVGDIATGIAMTSPIAAATAPIYASSTALGAGVLGAGEGALGTLIGHYGTQGDLNITPSEAALGIGGGILGGELTRYLSRLPKTEADNIRKEAEGYINKSIKPTVKGKMSQADYDKFIDDTLDVVDLMNKNKDILQYTDDAGNIVTGKMPTNMRETSDVLGNLKKILYDQYDDIAKKAGDAGARVDMNKAFQQLDDLSKDISQNIANPQTQNIIDSYKNALLQYTDDAGTIAIEDAQKLTQDFNKQLTAFFKNPNMNDVSKNSIVAQLNKWTKDAINDSIDNVLDEGINNGSKASAEYVKLKGWYSKIKTIEDEISKRALVEARKNAKGLSSTILDSLSGGEFTSALLSLDPVKATKAGAMNLISRYYNYINNPNTQLNKLFDLVQSTNNPSALGTAVSNTEQAIKQGVKGVAGAVSKPNVVTQTATALQRNSEE